MAYRGGTLCILTAIAIMPLAEFAVADPVADFFRSKQMTIVVGSEPGGGYDAYARLMSRHYGRLVPGKPTVVLKYMPGASSLVAINHIAAVAPRDGLTIGAVQRQMPFEPLRGNKSARYDANLLIWLGSLNAEVGVSAVWHTAPHQTAQDVFRTPLIVGSSGALTESEIESHAMNNLIGTKFQVVSGYSGTAQTLLALERGEIQGINGWSWSNVKTQKADWLRDKKIRILLQTGIKPHPDLKGVPTVYDFVKNDEDRQVWDLLLAQKEMGRPYVLPPEVPAPHVAALRAAMDKLVLDEALLAEAEKTNTEIGYTSGREMETLIRRVYASPPAVIAKAAVVISRLTSAPTQKP